jgi:hypothetical protein
MPASFLPAESDSRAGNSGDGRLPGAHYSSNGKPRWDKCGDFRMSRSTRRDLLTSVPALAATGIATAGPPTGTGAAGGTSLAIRLLVDGQAHTLSLDARTTVLDA